MLLQGPAGWGEFCPFVDYDDQVSAWWLATALESAVHRLADPGPGPDTGQRHRPGRRPGARPRHRDRFRVCHRQGQGRRPSRIRFAEDLARLEAVRDALGPAGAIRVDANGVGTSIRRRPRHARWTSPPADSSTSSSPAAPSTSWLPCVDAGRACGSPPTSRSGGPRIPFKVAVAGAADLAVIKCTPLGGVRRALESPRPPGFPAWSRPPWRPASGSPPSWPSPVPYRNWTSPAAWARCRCCVVTSSMRHRRSYLHQGHLTVPAAPPTPDPALLDRYELTDHDRRAWWTERLRRTLAILVAR